MTFSFRYRSRNICCCNSNFCIFRVFALLFGLNFSTIKINLFINLFVIQMNVYYFEVILVMIVETIPPLSAFFITMSLFLSRLKMLCHSQFETLDLPLKFPPIFFFFFAKLKFSVVFSNYYINFEADICKFYFKPKKSQKTFKTSPIFSKDKWQDISSLKIKDKILERVDKGRDSWNNKNITSKW